MAERIVGNCEHCHETFEYRLNHCGFGDCVYAYCDSCGMAAILSLWDKRMPKLGCPTQQEMCAALQPYLRPCDCGGIFKRGGAPRCPHCREALSPEVATSYIERNAPGTKVGWRWQGNWSGPYCIVIEENKVEDNFR
jgi:hypothetical protein